MYLSAPIVGLNMNCSLETTYGGAVNKMSELAKNQKKDKLAKKNRQLVSYTRVVRGGSREQLILSPTIGAGKYPSRQVNHGS